ncbi:hypothetical protein GGH13_005206 [Coemansia sp. S155-1]|nr:hypothetical protein GGH13_005206 [Coemansia sp. S155-1]
MHVGTPLPLRINREAALRILEGPVNRRAPPSAQFRAEEIAQANRELDIAGRAAGATKIEIYTDGSLQPGRGSRDALMGFVAIFQFQRAGPTVDTVTMAGATRDGPFSSTMAELMAILAVLAVLPSDAKATLWCDSKAAIAYVDKLQNKRDCSWRKSPMAYLAQFHVSQIRRRQMPIAMKWIRGHTGNKGNKAADCAAKGALSRPQGWWSLRLGSLPEQKYYACVGRMVAPYKIGGMIKRQEEARAVQCLWRAVVKANPSANFLESNLKETLEALNWSTVEKDGIWIRKNSWCRTSVRDSNIHGFVIGALFGLLPVALREWAWYPHVYEQDEWRMCPKCHREEETQAHFFTCEEGRTILGPAAGETEANDAEVGTTDRETSEACPSQGSRPRENNLAALRPRQDRWILVQRLWMEATATGAGGETGETEYRAVPDENPEGRGPIDQWITTVAGERVPYIGIPREWVNGSASAISAEMCQFGSEGRSWIAQAVANKEELKSANRWAHLVRKAAIRMRWQKEYEEHWLWRNDAQIRKEKASDVQPKKRRQAMHEQRPPAMENGRADGMPKFDVESPAKKRNEYAALCKVLVGDWSRGVRSQVPGRGLWSVNTKYT